MQQVYNVNLGNAGSGHSTLNRIYEDTLPTDITPLTYNTLNERSRLINFLRQTIGGNDEDEMTLQGTGTDKIKSVLSYTSNRF